MIASTGHASAASLQRCSNSSGTSSILTTARSPTILKTWGQISAQLPSPTHSSSSILTLIVASSHNPRLEQEVRSYCISNSSTTNCQGGIIPFLNQGAIFVGSVVANPHVHIVRSGFLLLAASISSLLRNGIRYARYYSIMRINLFQEEDFIMPEPFAAIFILPV